MLWGRRIIHKISPTKLQCFRENWCEPSVSYVQNVVRNYEDVALDIGCGRGELSLFLAKKDPKLHVLACDVFLNGLVHLNYSMMLSDISNISIVQSDVLDVLDAMGQRRIRYVACFFPDPWPKARHQKRRLLLREGVIEKIQRILCDGGVFLWRSDNADYHYAIESRVRAVGMRVVDPWEIPAITTYERKARENNRAIYSGACCR